MNKDKSITKYFQVSNWDLEISFQDAPGGTGKTFL